MMIGMGDIYKVVVAMTPLYVALVLGYGSVKWWKMFSPEQCDAINKFVCYFTLPLFTFHFTSQVDPFGWNYKFLAADAISKVIIVIVLVAWAKGSSNGCYTWLITSFSLSTLTNSLVVGVPMLKAMYGDLGVNIVVESTVFQGIVWLSTLLFVLEFRKANDSSSLNIVDSQMVNDLERNDNSVSDTTIPRPSFLSMMKTVCVKLILNPNAQASVIGITWAFISNRWHIEMPTIVEESVLIMSKAGIGSAMFSMGLFTALQEKILACGVRLTLFGLVLRFIAGPAAMAIGCLAVGLRGDVLRVAIVQAALPQAIASFIYAKEYGLHADVLSTA
ncbi:auxin efflux carrier component 5-like isoform X2 [Papaver somniferum]|nr:auxin efflux carrier component 5-like isoform X2 [Papaver somniferum]